MSRLTSTIAVAGRMSPNTAPWALPDFLPILDIDDIHSGPHDVLQARTGRVQCPLDIEENLRCLSVRSPTPTICPGHPLPLSRKPTRAARHGQPESIPQSVPKECPLRFEFCSSRAQLRSISCASFTFLIKPSCMLICNFGDCTEKCSFDVDSSTFMPLPHVRSITQAFSLGFK